MDIKLNTSTSWWTIVICLAAGLAAGFWLGRMAFVTDERVRVVSLAAMEGGVDRLTPVGEVSPDATPVASQANMPDVVVVVRDTVFIAERVQVLERVDTAALIRDYETRRKYSELLFDSPDIGRLNVEFGVQYNRADSLRYVFIPVKTEVTRYVKSMIEPFAMVEYGTTGRVGIGGGAFYGRWGAMLRFERSFTGQRGVGVGFAYRF